MHRFFADASCIDDNVITVTGDDVQHISRVLRLKCGDCIEICDMCGTDYLCTVSSVSKTAVTANIIKKMPNSSESNLNITLYQGIPKGDKLDFIIQKSVELGAKRIVPVIMQRTVVKFKNAALKTERQRKIAAEAAKQSKRGIIPKVSSPISFDEMIDEIKNSAALSILAYENEEQTDIKSVLKNNGDMTDINIIIGPEGGFEDDEIKSAKEANINIVTLGPRILRCETAPVAVISAAMYELGDWKRI